MMKSTMQPPIRTSMKVEKEDEPSTLSTLLSPQPTLRKASKVSRVNKGTATAASVKECTNVLKDVPESLNSVNELFGLSEALSIFTRRFNELQKHMEFIDKSIDDVYKQQKDIESVVVAPLPVPAPNASTSCAPILSTANQTNANSAKAESSKEAGPSTIDSLCETMGSRGVRKYITMNMSDIEKLQKEVTAAIKRAPNPAKLVLDCMGRFYLQGSKAFIKDSPMISNRQASLLILEFFLLSDCTSIDPSVKEEAKKTAMLWRKRIVNEGGLSNATNADARGLLLFIASYGIPSDFENQDLIQLIRLSNAKDISNALRRSRVLVQKIPDIIHAMVKKGMCLAAVDAAYTFGVEEKVSPETILTLYLRDSEETWKIARKDSQGHPLALKTADEKQLTAYKFAMKCLEDHKINPMKLAEWNINDKIATLEKYISDHERVIEEKGHLKRKADGVNSSPFKNQDAKHPRMSTGLSPQMHSKFMLPQEQRAFGINDGQIFYDGRLSSQLNGYSGMSSVMGPTYPGAAGLEVLHRIVPGNVAGTSLGSTAGPGGVLHVEGLLHTTNHSAGSYAWHGDGALNDNLFRHNFMGPQTISGRGLFGSGSTMEQGFAGQPSSSLTFGTRNSSADLYQFADAVLEHEAYNSSRTANSCMAPETARLQR
ncbi:Frigida-like protein [Thalictrum thalictroides]|uniref:FRIGIDA-like protein n=1 Tax=Thalictrum thalictroides TaxID=46969 RepID=A0A7J6W1L4_THATH|nr:Frigida-like protein [Thalictrum thalictroides]